MTGTLRKSFGLVGLVLHRDWKTIVTRAWSVRLMLAAGILSGAEVGLQVLVGVNGGTIALAAVSALVTCAAFIARIVAQKDMPDGT